MTFFFFFSLLGGEVGTKKQEQFKKVDSRSCEGGRGKGPKRGRDWTQLLQVMRACNFQIKQKLPRQCMHTWDGSGRRCDGRGRGPNDSGGLAEDYSAAT